MSGAVLSMRCTCGALSSADCAYASGIPEAAKLLAAKGWRIDAKGHVQCPACAAKPVEDLTPEGVQLVIPGAERRLPPDEKQHELF